MGIITEFQLLVQSRSQKTSMTLSESLRSYALESSDNKIRIFLSHKHDERIELDGAITFLKNFGVDVYVDWLDESMPKSTSWLTAKKIKEKIKACDKFIFLATEGAISSKWCNWELGLGDIQKYDRNIALFPIQSKSSGYTGSEYLDIYPYIYKVEQNTILKGYTRTAGVYIVFPGNNRQDSLMPISDWFSS